MNLATPIRIGASFDAWLWGDPETDGDLPIEQDHGWVDPANPWGSFEQDVYDDSCEPAIVELPLAEAVEFLRDFPGGIWNYREAEAEQDFRTGRCKRVNAHVDANFEDLVFAAMESLDIR